MDQIVTDRKGQALLFVTIALGMLLDGLDGTIVTVALPEISEGLGIGTSGASWIITVYFLVMAGLILIFGKICDQGAIKKILMAGFAVFSAGSLFCGLSPSFEVLLLSRAFQGVGSAMLAASSVMLCVKFLPKHLVGLGLSVSVLGSAIGATIGPVMGAVLTEFISWHWIFFINVPIGLAAVALSKRAVPPDTGFDRSSFDYLGSAVLFIMMVAGLYTIESVPSHGITSVSAAAIAVFLVSLPAFVLYERRIDNPVLSLGVFRHPPFIAVTLCFVLINALYLGGIYLSPFFMDIELGLTVMQTGMVLMVPAIGMAALSLWSGRKSETFGNRVFAISGCALMTVFMLLSLLLDADTGMPQLVLTMLLLGLVWGVAGGTLGARIIATVPEGQKGSGSSLLSFFIYFGSALGTAMFSGLFGLGSHTTGSSISELAPDVFLTGFHFAMTVGAVLAVIALVLSVIVNEEKKRN